MQDKTSYFHFSFGIEQLRYFNFVHDFVTCLQNITPNDDSYIADSDLCEWRIRPEVLVHVERVDNMYVGMWNRNSVAHERNVYYRGVCLLGNML